MNTLLSIYLTVPGSNDLDISAVLAPLTKTHNSVVKSQIDAALTTLLRFAAKNGDSDHAIYVLRSFMKLLLIHIQMPDNRGSTVTGCKGLWVLLGQLILKVDGAAGDFIDWFTKQDACKALLGSGVSSEALTFRHVFNCLLLYTQALFSADTYGVVSHTATSGKELTPLESREAYLCLPKMATYLQGFILLFLQTNLTNISTLDQDKEAYTSSLQMIIRLCSSHNSTFIATLTFPSKSTASTIDSTEVTHGHMLIHLALRPDEFRLYVQDDSCPYALLLKFLHPESSPVLFMLVADAERLISNPRTDWSSRYYLTLFETIVSIDSFGSSGLLMKLPYKLSPLALPIYGRVVSRAIDSLLRTRKTQSKTFWKLVEIQLSCFNIFPSDAVFFEMRKFIVQHGKASIFISRMISAIDHKTLSPQDLSKIIKLYALFLIEGDAPTAGIVRLKVEELIRDFPSALQEALPHDLFIRVCLRSHIDISKEVLCQFLLGVTSFVPGSETFKECTIGLFKDFLATCTDTHCYYSDLCCGVPANSDAILLPLAPLLLAINNTFGTNLHQKEYALLFTFFFGGADRDTAEVVYAQIQPLISKYIALFSNTLTPEMLGSESQEYAPLGVLHFLLVQGGLEYFVMSSQSASSSENIISRFNINKTITLQILTLGSCLFTHLPDTYLDILCAKFIDECINTCNFQDIMVTVNKAFVSYSFSISVDTSIVDIPSRIGRMLGYFIKYLYNTYQAVENDELLGILVGLSNLSILCKDSSSLVLFADEPRQSISEQDIKQVISEAGYRIAQTLNYIFKGANMTEKGTNGLLNVSYILSPINQRSCGQQLRSPLYSPTLDERRGISSIQAAASPNGTSIMIGDLHIKRQHKAINSPAYRMLWLYTPFFLELLDTLSSIVSIPLKLNPTCLHVPMGWVSFGINRPSEMHSTEFGRLLTEEIYVPVIDHYGLKGGKSLELEQFIAEIPLEEQRNEHSTGIAQDAAFLDASLFSVNTILPYPISPSSHDYPMSQRFSVKSENLSMLLSTYPMSYMRRLFGCINLWRSFLKTDPTEAMRQLSVVPFFVTTLNCRSTSESIRSLYSSLIDTLEKELSLTLRQRFSSLLSDMAMMLFNRFKTISGAFSQKRRSYGIVNGILCFAQCAMLAPFADFVANFIIRFLKHPNCFDDLACHDNLVSYIHLAEGFYLSFISRDGKSTMSTISRRIGSEALVSAIEHMGTSNWEIRNAWMSFFGTVAKTTFYNTYLNRRKLLDRLNPSALERVGNALERLIYAKGTGEHAVEQILSAGLIYAHVPGVQSDNLRLFKSIIHLLFSPHISLRVLAGKIFAVQFDDSVEQMVAEVLCWLRTAEFVDAVTDTCDSATTYGDRLIMFSSSMLPDLKCSPLSRRICSLMESRYNRQKHVVTLLESLSFVLHYADCSGNELCYGILDLLQRLKVSEEDVLIIRSRAYSLGVRE